jgi:hypothetical protein
MNKVVIQRLNKNFFYSIVYVRMITDNWLESIGINACNLPHYPYFYILGCVFGNHHV